MNPTFLYWVRSSQRYLLKSQTHKRCKLWNERRKICILKLDMEFELFAERNSSTCAKKRDRYQHEHKRRLSVLASLSVDSAYPCPCVVYATPTRKKAKNLHLQHIIVNNFSAQRSKIFMTWNQEKKREHFAWWKFAWKSPGFFLGNLAISEAFWSS